MSVTVRFREVLREATAVVRWIWRHPSNSGRRFRQLGRASLFQILGRLRPRPVTTPLGNRSRIWAELHVSSSSRTLYANPPDASEMLVWRLRLGPGDLFVDVGANVGVYTVYVLELGVEVIAIEPDPVSAERLRLNLSLNDYTATVIEAVLADDNGGRELTVGLDSTNRLVSAGTECQSRPVTSFTLDAVIGDRTASGVKIDVEGAEWLVLRGAEKALRERRIKLLQLEWNDCSRRNFGYDRTALAEWLWSVGYEIVVPTAHGMLVPPDPMKYDDVFARPAEG